MKAYGMFRRQGCKLLVCFAFACSPGRQDNVVVEVTGGEGASGIAAPVSLVSPPGDIKGSTAEMIPEHDPGASPIYAQVMTEGAEKHLVFLDNPGQTSGKSVRRFILREPSGQPPDPFAFEKRDDGFLTLTENGSPVLTYVYGMNLKDGVPKDRTRANYVHPVYGLDGEIVTDDFPDDHHHHRGMYTAWPRIIVDGDSLDLWHIRGIEKRFERWLERETGPVFARLVVLVGWYAGEEKVVEETLGITVYRAGAIGRAVDFDFTFAAERPLTILGSPDLKGYGGFNYRPAPFGEPVITTEEGVQADSNLRRFPWADFSAKFEGAAARSGVAVFDHADNLNTPNGWCLRHYGFLGVAWPGNNPYLLQPGKPLRTMYRVWIHRGDAGSGRVSSAYVAYADPPQAAVVR